MGSIGQCLMTPHPFVLTKCCWFLSTSLLFPHQSFLVSLPSVHSLPPPHSPYPVPSLPRSFPPFSCRQLMLACQQYSYFSGESCCSYRSVCAFVCDFVCQKESICVCVCVWRSIYLLSIGCMCKCKSSVYMCVSDKVIETVTETVFECNCRNVCIQLTYFQYGCVSVYVCAY